MSISIVHPYLDACSWIFLQCSTDFMCILMFFISFFLFDVVKFKPTNQPNNTYFWWLPYTSTDLHLSTEPGKCFHRLDCVLVQVLLFPCNHYQWRNRKGAYAYITLSISKSRGVSEDIWKKKMKFDKNKEIYCEIRLKRQNMGWKYKKKQKF